MEEFKGIKGEWLLAQSPKKGFDSIIYTQEAGEAGINTICLIPDGNNNNNVSESNAKLIAAAPELLEALQKIASNSNDHAMIRIAIKAIQKALK